MSGSKGKSVAVGLCKRCGKIIEYSPITIINREINPPCLSFGESSVKEVQNELYKNAKYCGECSKEVRSAFFRKLLSLPKLIFKIRIK
ncbi:MAG: hypothetical protein K0S75_1162 [Clostridia bacterium]|jgi:hypothetical protein|nr:hypothetical protein [Clostridia bacterium]